MKQVVCCPPILFVIFNRPDLTRRVFKQIRQAKPKHLFIAADGPRADYSSDAELCEEARAVIDRIDWDCVVRTLYRNENLGCKLAVSSAITWFFDHVDQGIILEDDCLAHQSFFRFCSELLERYREDERIMMISGDNFQGGQQRTQYSYYFSRLTHIWGWASWQRAWQHFDISLTHWPALRETQWLQDILGDKEAAAYWYSIYERMYAGKIDTWDYAWSYSCWAQNGLAILPEVNLVSNIGFGEQATHTKTSDSRFSVLPTAPMEFPLRHPPYVRRHSEADQFTLSEYSRSGSMAFPKRMIRKFLSTLSKPTKHRISSSL